MSAASRWCRQLAKRHFHTTMDRVDALAARAQANFRATDLGWLDPAVIERLRGNRWGRRPTTWSL